VSASTLKIEGATRGQSDNRLAVAEFLGLLAALSISGLALLAISMGWLVSAKNQKNDI